MKILIVYYKPLGLHRNTINEHLSAFKRFSGASCYYLNVYSGVPGFIEYIKFDLIVYHYTILSEKFSGYDYFRDILNRCEPLKKIQSFKVAMPQDEYLLSDVICSFLKEFQINKLFTCFYEEDWEKVYPVSKTGVELKETCLTGYIDEDALKKIQVESVPHAKRLYDIGYRARKVPYWLGEHGTIKWRLTEVVQSMSSKFPKLNMNISNSEKDVFTGQNWYKFLLNCRTVLGCEGGASLLDTDGSLRKKVDDYAKKYPGASFEEVRDKLFQGQDFEISLFAISPRHFEACLTRTCQVLVEGKYHGIFTPNIHYIPLKKDFSNLEEVLKKVEDRKLCEELAERAYQDVILSGKYTYRQFINGIVNDVHKYHQVSVYSLRDFIFWQLAKLLSIPLFLNTFFKRCISFIKRRTFKSV